MINTITLELVVAYSKCLRKAFLSLWPESQATPHEYMRLLEEQACRSRHEYLQRIEHKYPAATTGDVTKFLTGEQILLSVQLKAHDLVANCDVLTKVHCGTSLGTHRYEPTIIVGTHQISKDQKLAILFVGYVLGQLQGQLPEIGAIVGADGRVHKVDMKGSPGFQGNI